MTPNFEKSTHLATELLYNQDISHRILDVRTLEYSKNIVFDSLQAYCQYTRQPIERFISEENSLLKDSCTLYDRETNYYIVLYNDDIRIWERKNWSIAHEIGHIYLEHTKDEEIEEVESHFFAAQLLMPEYTLYKITQEYGSIQPNYLTEIFGVSNRAAKKRIGTMKRKRSFRAMKKDKEIWDIHKEKVEIFFRCLEDGSCFRNTLNFHNLMKTEYEQLQREEMAFQRALDF